MLSMIRWKRTAKKGICIPLLGTELQLCSSVKVMALGFPQVKSTESVVTGLLQIAPQYSHDIWHLVHGATQTQAAWCTKCLLQHTNKFQPFCHKLNVSSLSGAKSTKSFVMLSLKCECFYLSTENTAEMIWWQFLQKHEFVPFQMWKKWRLECTWLHNDCEINKFK